MGSYFVPLEMYLRFMRASVVAWFRFGYGLAPRRVAILHGLRRKLPWTLEKCVTSRPRARPVSSRASELGSALSLRPRRGTTAWGRVVRRELVLGALATLRVGRDRHGKRRFTRLDDRGRSARAEDPRRRSTRIEVERRVLGRRARSRSVARFRGRHRGRCRGQSRSRALDLCGLRAA